MQGEKVCAITGCNSGIGKHTAIELAKKGYTVFMLVRDSDKSRYAYEEIKRQSGSEGVYPVYVDLASLTSIKSAAEELKSKTAKIDVLINNAGILKRNKEESKDGVELTIAVNYLAPVYLTKLLLPLIEKAEKGRIINLSSELYKNGAVVLENDFSRSKFDGMKAYADSKLLIIYFTRSLAKKLANKNITVNALHPGVVGTDVFREYPNWLSSFLNIFITSPEKGAQPSIYLATSEEVDSVSGEYFNKSERRDTAEVANDENLGERIWEKTEELINRLT